MTSKRIKKPVTPAEFNRALRAATGVPLPKFLERLNYYTWMIRRISEMVGELAEHASTTKRIRTKELAEELSCIRNIARAIGAGHGQMAAPFAEWVNKADPKK